MISSPQCLLFAVLTGPTTDPGARFTLPTFPSSSPAPRAKDPSLQSVFSAYAWMAAQSGSLAADGIGGDADDRIADALGGVGNLEGAGNLEWLLRGGDRTGAYLGFEALRQRTDDGGSPRTDLDTDHRFLEGALTWRLFPEDVRRGSEYALDVMIGARWNDLEVQVTRKATSERGKDTFDWLEPFVGLRLEHQWKEEIQVWARGDLGGFGLGEASDRVWHAMAAFEWKAADRLSALGGWRWERLSFSRHAKAFDYDVRLQGPFLGVSFRY